MSHFDKVVIGAGLSGFSLIDRWLDAGALPSGTKVAIIDSHIEAVREKTFAYWRLKSDRSFRFHQLADHRWERFRVNQATDQSGFHGKSLSFEDYVYERISGERFYAHVYGRMCVDSRFTWIKDKVARVRDGSPQITIQLESGGELSTNELWSSAVAESKPPLLQHFLGYEIETEIDAFEAEVVDLMDFRVPQRGETRFVYILPFSKRTALVEFTVFSRQVLTEAEYKRELHLFLSCQLGLDKYRILRTEKGAIPMALDLIPRFAGFWPGSKIHPIGAAAGQIKASTGYSFRRNQKCIAPSLEPMNRAQWRFYVYDALLLGIISSDGERMSLIFPHLFATNSPQLIFKFLDEETRFFEELKIFYNLPWAPFLKNLVSQFPFLVGVVLTLLVFPFGHLGVPVLGVAFLGIAHGALDHRLNPVPKDETSFFFVKYLSLILSYVALWWLTPPCAFLLFLILSVEHFGDCQFARALRITPASFGARFFGYLWGAFATLGAPLFHWDEALPIIRSILREPSALMFVPLIAPKTIAVALGVCACWSASWFDHFEFKSTGRPRTALPATLLLVGAFLGLPLLAGFLCFFCFWHSADSIRQQMEKREWQLTQYFRGASILTIASWVSLALLIRWVGFNLGFLFVALGALTLAHSQVMKKFYRG